MFNNFSSLIMDVIQLTTSAPLSWKYGFPCEPLTLFNISCIVIIDRGPAPNLSRMRARMRGEPVLSFLFSLTTYKCIRRTHSLIHKRMLKNQLSRWIQWFSYQHSSWMSYQNHFSTLILKIRITVWAVDTFQHNLYSNRIRSGGYAFITLWM